MKTIYHSSAWMVLAAAAWLSLPLVRGQAETVEWISQLGTGSHEDAIGVSADGLGNVYIAGETNGSLGGSAGGSDAFIAKFDSAGKLAWTTPRQVPTARQIGTSGDDHGYGVSADGLGNVYMSGSTTGNLGGTNAGGHDAFVTKWDSAGTLLWTRQLGTAAEDISYAVSADGLGNVYMSGYTGGSLDGIHAGNDGFVSKYDAAGTLLWTRQSGFSGVGASYGVSADGLGNVFVTGTAGTSAYVSKYDAFGTPLWTELSNLGSPSGGRGGSTDGVGNVYITGTTDGGDTFLSKYDAAGGLQWTRVFGGGGYDESFGVSADGVGNVFITGRTDGAIGGPNLGIEDAFVIKYDAAGNLIWTKQLGTSSYEGSLAVSVDRLGSVYTAGGTEGSMGTANRGFGDAFVVKINDTSVPESMTGLLLVVAGLPFWCSRRRVAF